METVIPAIGGLISYGAGKRTDIQSTCRKYQFRKLRGKGEGIIRVRRKPILFERYILSTRRIHIYIYMYDFRTAFRSLKANRIPALQLSFRERFDVVNRGRSRARRNKNGNKKEKMSVNRKG